MTSNIFNKRCQRIPLLLLLTWAAVYGADEYEICCNKVENYISHFYQDHLTDLSGAIISDSP